jgi:non-specific serine/threonine protein kinase
MDASAQESAPAWAAAGVERTRRVHDFLAAHTLAELPDVVVRLGDVWSLCERCVADGDAAAAAALYARLVAFATRAGAPPAGFWSSAAAHYLGLLAAMLARWDVAAAHFEEALRLCAGRGAGLDAAPTQCAYARLLLARGGIGDHRKAHRLLAELIANWHGFGLSTACASDAGESPAVRTPRAGRVEQPADGADRCRYVLRREGDYWTLNGDGRVARVRGMRGLDYLAELLRHPYEQIYVVDLAAVGMPGERRLSRAEAVEQGLRVSGETGVDAGLDRRACADYRARWNELVTEADAARRDNDPGRVERVQHEIDMLTAELAAAAGRGSSRRGGPSFKERARVNVRNCITAALRAVRRHDEMVWRHLLNSIKTGTFCCYAPDRPVEWEM